MKYEAAASNYDKSRPPCRSLFQPGSSMLFYLCDEEENHILSAVMEFLTINDIGRCEMVCRYLKIQVGNCWTMLDKALDVKEFPTRLSPSAKTKRDRVIRYHLASTLARRIGSIGNSISKHLIHLRRDNNNLCEAEVNGSCKGCHDFPDNLNFGVLHEETANEYDLFVRFARTIDNTTFAEGFVPFTHNHDNAQLDIHLDDLDFSNWPQLLEISNFVVSESYAFFEDDVHGDLLDDCLTNVTAIVIGVNKKNSKASLVIAQSDFGDTNNRRPGTPNGGIDFLGCKGVCWALGRFSSVSHGPLPVEKSFYRGSLSYEHQNSDADLGIFFELLVSTTDQSSESHPTFEEKCSWTLQCNFTLRDPPRSVKRRKS